MNAVGIGILYLVLGNMVAVFSDALVKVLEPDQPVFQFVFFRQLSAAILLAPGCSGHGVATRRWRSSGTCCEPISGPSASA